MVFVGLAGSRAGGRRDEGVEVLSGSDAHGEDQQRAHQGQRVLEYRGRDGEDRRVLRWGIPGLEAVGFKAWN